jgi:hypothetical protein
VVQQPTKFKKEIAIDLRKRGSSYSEIENSISIPKSTLAYWLKDVILTPEQKQKLQEKRKKVAQTNSQKRISGIYRKIEEIKKSSVENIKNISKREFWLMGIMLYWREGLLSNNENDLRKGVRFTSSNPRFIRLFLKWLREVGKIEKTEIEFDIFANRDKKKLIKDIISHWSKITKFSKNKFSHIYYQKSAIKGYKIKRSRISKSSNFGFIRIRVRASSMLARQIAGWMKGIEHCLSMGELI